MVHKKIIPTALSFLLRPFVWLGDAAAFLSGYAKRQNRPIDEAQRQLGLQWIELMREATEDDPLIFEVSVRLLRKEN